MSDTRVEQLLAEVSQGYPGSQERLIELVYADLHRMARAQIALGVGSEGTLGATALVHEAWLRLEGDLDGVIKNQAYFYGAAAQAMRRALIDYARARGAKKRGGDRRRLPLEGIDLSRAGRDDELLAVDGIIEQLAEEDDRLAEVVRLRFWAGLNVEAVANALGCSSRTVKRDWAYARAFMIDALGIVDEQDEDQG